MPITMSSASLPVFQHMLGNLSYLLDKAASNAEARKFDPSVLVQSRLSPDMLPFARQVLIDCDAAKKGASRISGMYAPKVDDTVSSVP